MPSRRTYLTALVGSGTVLGGCIGRTSPGTEAGPRTETRTGTEAGTADPPDRTDPTDVSGSWTHRDADARATMATDTDPMDATPEPLWTAELEGDHRQIRLAGDALYTATGTRLARRSLADGVPVWERSFDDGVRLGAALEDLYLTVGKDEPTLRALEPAGTDPPTERWSRAGARFRCADADLVVATGRYDATLYGLESDGSDRWTLAVGDVDLGVDVEGERFDSVALGPDHVFAAVESGGSAAWIAGIERDSRRVAWTDAGPNHAGLLTVTPETVLSGGFYGKVFAWSHDGESLWTARTTPPTGSIAVADGTAFVSANADSEPAVTVLDGSGESLWTRPAGGVVAVDTDAAYVLDDGVVALDPENGDERWQLDTPAVGVVPADGGLFVIGETELRLFG